MFNPITFTIIGQAASKANGRKLVRVKNRLMFIKSKPALAFESYMAAQCPTLPALIDEDIRVDILILYESKRPDLDESLILDGMQGRIFHNDRQVREKHVYWGLDKVRPRCIIRVSPLGAVPDFLVSG